MGIIVEEEGAGLRLNVGHPIVINRGLYGIVILCHEG